MSGHFFRTNRWLVTAAVLVCILSGGLFTHSAAAPSRDHSENSTGVLIAENTKDNKSTQTTEKVTDLKETKSTKDTGDTEKKATSGNHCNRIPGLSPADLSCRQTGQGISGLTPSHQ